MASSSSDISATQSLPLQGVRIIAIEQYGAGPWATMLLADMGAEVIKIENPLTKGDIGRYVPPYTSNEDSIYFQSFNRNKRSITLNLAHPDARDVLHPLVRISDAVFNNLRGDLPKKLGIDFPTLSEINNSIVCCSLSAFGRTGIRSAEPGYDYLMQGYAGWMSITGEPNGPPQKSGLSLVDLSAGTMASLGLMSALIRVKQTGVGCDVDVSLFDNAISHLAYIGAWHLSKGYQAQRLPDSSHPSQIPSQVLPTKNGWMVVMCAKEKFYKNLVEILGSPELAYDNRFDTFEGRLKNKAVLVPILKELSSKRSTCEWLDLLKGKVPCAPVNTVQQAFEDFQVTEDEMVLELDHHDFGSVRQVASPIKVSDSRITHKRAPKLGEDTDNILTDYLGFSSRHIANLRSNGVL